MGRFPPRSGEIILQGPMFDRTMIQLPDETQDELFIHILNDGET